MAKKRVHEIAKEKGITSKEAVAILQQAGLEVKSHSSSVEESDAARAFDNGAQAAAPAAAAAEPPAQAAPPTPEPPAAVASRICLIAVAARAAAPITAASSTAGIALPVPVEPISAPRPSRAVASRRRRNARGPLRVDPNAGAGSA
jgi:translation initiation factor IF-2